MTGVASMSQGSRREFLAVSAFSFMQIGSPNIIGITSYTRSRPSGLDDTKEPVSCTSRTNVRLWKSELSPKSAYVLRWCAGRKSVMHPEPMAHES